MTDQRARAEIARYDLVKMVEKESFTDFDGLKAVLADDAVKLLARQHRAFVRMVRKRSHEYMKDASDSKLSKAMQASAASKAWAFKDFADDLAALAKQGWGKK